MTKHGKRYEIAMEDPTRLDRWKINTLSGQFNYIMGKLYRNDSLVNSVASRVKGNDLGGVVAVLYILHKKLRERLMEKENETK